MSGHKGSLGCILVAGVAALAVSLPTSGFAGGTQKAMAFTAIQAGLKWLLVEPLGVVGAVGVILLSGVAGAILLRPRDK